MFALNSLYFCTWGCKLCLKANKPAILQLKMLAGSFANSRGWPDRLAGHVWLVSAMHLPTKISHGASSVVVWTGVFFCILFQRQENTVNKRKPYISLVLRSQQNPGEEGCMVFGNLCLCLPDPFSALVFEAFVPLLLSPLPYKGYDSKPWLWVLWLISRETGYLSQCFILSHTQRCSGVT